MSTTDQTLDKIKQTLSKQSSDQLIAKLEKGTLFNSSKDLAIEILKKRGVDVARFEESKPVKSTKASVTPGKKSLDIDAQATKGDKKKKKSTEDELGDIQATRILTN